MSTPTFHSILQCVRPHLGECKFESVLRFPIVFQKFSFHSNSVSGYTQSPQINLKNLRNIWNAKCPNSNAIQPFLAVQQCPSTHRCFEISRVVKSRSKNLWAAARQSSRPSIWLIRGKLSPIRLRPKSDLISDYEYVNIRNIKMNAP